MNYMTFTVYDEDYEDIRLYFYNEALDRKSDIKTIIKESKAFIAKDLKGEGKDLKRYKAANKIRSYKEIGKELKRYKIIDYHPEPDRDPSLNHYKNLYMKNEDWYHYAKLDYSYSSNIQIPRK